MKCPFLYACDGTQKEQGKTTPILRHAELLGRSHAFVSGDAMKQKSYTAAGISGGRHCISKKSVRGSPP